MSWLQQIKCCSKKCVAAGTATSRREDSACLCQAVMLHTKAELLAKQITALSGSAILHCTSYLANAFAESSS
jgi:hypothetical protein